MDRQPAQSFEDLIVWQKARAFVLNVSHSSFFLLTPSS